MKKLINKILSYQLSIGLILLNLVLIVVYTPSHFYFEMIQSMAFQIMLVIAALFVLFIGFKKWVGALSSMLALGLLFSQIPLWSEDANLDGNVKIAHFNVLKHNQSYLQTIDAALSSNADFLSFNEVTPEWECQLIDELRDSYPYYISQLADNNSFGIAVFSKTPIQDTTIHYWGSENIPTLSGNIHLLGTKVHFVAAHTIPPVTKENYSLRNNHLHDIKLYLRSIDGAKILVGDLNAVSWSPAIKTLRAESQVLDSRKSWLPTYPSWASLIAIPIDHIFHSQEIYCTDFYTIKSTNSDHYGIVGEYYVNEIYGQKN